MRPIFISGHRNPDTDSIVGAICYADFKKKQGVTGVVPSRLGEINAETKFVLDRFKLEEPKLLKSVKTQVSDLDMNDLFSVKASTPVKIVLETMHNTNISSVMIVDDNGKLEGVVSFGDIARSDVEIVYQENVIETTASNIADTVNGTLVCGNGGTVRGKVTVVTREELKEACGIVIAQYEDGIEEDAAASGAELVVLCKAAGAKRLNESIATNTVVTSFGLFQTTRLISQAVPVCNVMTKNKLVAFSLHDYLDDVRDVILGTRYKSFPVYNESGIVVGVITRNHLIKSSKKQVILIDHNEKAQSIPGIEQAVITEIIDHHRVADLETAQPLFIRSEPVGSSNTIIASMYKDAGITPSKEIAGAMLCGILSDTVLFKSPTCTQKDRDIAEYLAKISGENIEELGNELFTAGSTLVQEGAEAMVGKDFKEFNLGGKRIGIGQITIWDTDMILSVQDDIKNVMKRRIDNDGYDIVLFMETSIKTEGTLLVCAGDYQKIVEATFGKRAENDQLYLEGVMSRKKQIVPPLQSTIN